MRIDLAHAQGAALDVVLQPRHAKAGQQRRHQHDGRAHLFGQVVLAGIEMRVAVVQFQLARLVVHVNAGAELLEDIEDLAHIGDVWHAMQGQRLAGQQGGA
ncbi:hypothetical protein D3C72_1538680 [compost metagenome]